VVGARGDELRMVRGVQRPAQFIGGQRRFVVRKSQPANCARRRWHNDVVEFRGRQDDSTCSGAWLRHGLRRVVLLVGRARGRRRAAALSLFVASSQVRQRRVRVRQRGVSLGQGPLARRDVSMVHQKLRRRWRTTCKLLHACCWQEWRSVPGAGA